MSFKDLNIKRSYETTIDKDQLLNEFYIPVLSQSTNYYRIAGFFSSSSLSIAMRGVEAMVNNGGTIKILVSPELSEDDYSVLKNNAFTDASVLFKNFKLEDIRENDHLGLFAWLLANEKLELKIVINKKIRNSLFHQKVGVMIDKENNMISFSGSVNETAQAWLNNIEEFKTFKSWIEGQNDYLQDDLKKFVQYWNDDKEHAIVYDIPQALKEEIIKRKPKDIDDLSIMHNYVKKRKKSESKLSLFPHQSLAVDEWLLNNKSILMEMATGTGKTRTALGCMMELLKSGESFLAIVATPQGTLSRQWKKDVEDLKIMVDFQTIIDGSNSKWSSELEKLILDLSFGLYNNGIIYTTHATCSDKKFIRIMDENKGNLKVLFICDEVHGIGSAKQKNALLPIYDYRIGLSATPERMFDEGGTNQIRNYFGNKSFEFTISQALHTINPITGKPFLNRYLYKPVFVDLNDKEMEKYKKITQNIIYLKHQDDYDEKDLNILYTKRANVLKNAEYKFDVYKNVINELQDHGHIKDTISFVTEKQMPKVMKYLAEQGIIREKITEEESATRKVTNDGLTEREKIIRNFKDGTCQMLLGLKCLDEGIDIPNARIAILLASSTNPREYIQRVGRVIRQNPNKDISIIYDLIVAPNDGSESSRQILEKEWRRANVIAQNAENYEIVKQLFELRGVNVDVDK